MCSHAVWLAPAHSVTCMTCAPAQGTYQAAMDNVLDSLPGRGTGYFPHLVKGNIVSTLSVANCNRIDVNTIETGFPDNVGLKRLRRKRWTLQEIQIEARLIRMPGVRVMCQVAHSFAIHSAKVQGLLQQRATAEERFLHLNLSFEDVLIQKNYIQASSASAGCLLPS